MEEKELKLTSLFAQPELWWWQWQTTCRYTQ